MVFSFPTGPTFLRLLYVSAPMRTRLPVLAAGLLALSVADVAGACERFESLGVPFKKRPQDGKMKDIAFITDPDGYWIEILSASGMKDSLPPR